MSKTRINVNTGKTLTLDLTLVSNNIALICDWSVYQHGTIGSDHYPVLFTINMNTSVTEVDRGGRWILEKVN